MSLLARMLVLLLAPAAAAAGTPLLAPWVGPNVRLGEDPPELAAAANRNQAEPHVARSVADPDLLLATFQESRLSNGGADANGHAVSEDGGFTWRRGINPRLTVLQGGPYYRATDPVAAIARDGTLYLNSLVAVDSEFRRGRQVVQRSDDRGFSWSDPVTIFTGSDTSTTYIFPDKNWMAVDDHEASPHPGRLVVTWTSFRTIRTAGTDIDDALVMSAYSDSRGSTWSAPVFITPADSATYSRSQYQGSQPVFLPGGGLAVVFHSFNRSRLEVAYSPDGGASWPQPAVPVHAGYILYDVPNLRDGNFLPTVQAARATGDLYGAYLAKPQASSTYGRIYFTRSRRPDPGGSPAAAPDWRFDPPVAVSGSLPGRPVGIPTLAVSPDGQRVTITFLDQRNAGASLYADFYCVESADGGATWTAPFRLTETTFDVTLSTSTASGYMLGDYFGLAAPAQPGEAAVAVWIDTRSGTADPWSARVAAPAGPIFAAWLQANLPYAIHSAGAAVLRHADHDRDGVPNLIEYITGGSPLSAEPVPALADALSLALLAPATDPAMQVQVSASTGRWPDMGFPAAVAPQRAPLGEGYWDNATWAQAGQAGNIAFLLNGTERWHLLDETVPFRWVRALDGGWMWSPWFGYLYTAQAPWLFHLTLGWLYDVSGYLYSPAFSAWVYPSPAIHPWVLRQDGSYLYLIDGTPWVYDYATAQWRRAY